MRALSLACTIALYVAIVIGSSVDLGDGQRGQLIDQRGEVAQVSTWMTHLGKSYISNKRSPASGLTPAQRQEALESMARSIGSRAAARMKGRLQPNTQSSPNGPIRTQMDYDFNIGLHQVIEAARTSKLEPYNLPFMIHIYRNTVKENLPAKLRSEGVIGPVMPGGLARQELQEEDMPNDWTRVQRTVALNLSSAAKHVLDQVDQEIRLRRARTQNRLNNIGVRAFDMFKGIKVNPAELYAV